MKTLLPDRRLSDLSLLIVVSVLLCGCMPDLKSEVPPDRVYWLETTDLMAPPALQLHLQVAPGLATDHLLLLEQDQRLNIYAGAYWPDSLQPLLESLLQRSLGVGSAGPRLDVYVERFFAVAAAAGQPSGAPGVPRVEIRALLSTGDSVCRFTRSQVAGSNRLRDIVAAHQGLLDALAEGIADFGRTGICS